MTRGRGSARGLVQCRRGRTAEQREPVVDPLSGQALVSAGPLVPSPAPRAQIEPGTEQVEKAPQVSFWSVHMSLLMMRANSRQIRTGVGRVPRVTGRAMKHDAQTRPVALERPAFVLSHHHHARFLVHSVEQLGHGHAQSLTRSVYRKDCVACTQHVLMRRNSKMNIQNGCEAPIPPPPQRRTPWAAKSHTSHSAPSSNRGRVVLPPLLRHTESSGKSSGRCAGVRSLTCSCGCRVFVTSNHLTGTARRLPFSLPPAPVRLSNL